MNKIFAAICMAFVALFAASLLMVIMSMPAHAQEWVPITESDVLIVEMQKNSATVTGVQPNGFDNVQIHMRYIGKPGSGKPQIQLWLASVSGADCGAKAGALWLQVPTKRSAPFDVPFMFDGGTIASKSAEFICSVGAYQVWSKYYKNTQ